jgi:outer membrane protein assembly factor BamB
MLLDAATGTERWVSDTLPSLSTARMQRSRHTSISRSYAAIGTTTGKQPSRKAECVVLRLNDGTEVGRIPGVVCALSDEYLVVHHNGTCATYRTIDLTRIHTLRGAAFVDHHALTGSLLVSRIPGRAGSRSKRVEFTTRDLATGSVVWSIGIGDRFTDGSPAGPIVSSEPGTVLVGSGQYLTALDAVTGEVRWESGPGGNPFVAGAVIVAELNLGSDRDWYVLDAGTGRPLAQLGTRGAYFRGACLVGTRLILASSRRTTEVYDLAPVLPAAPTSSPDEPDGP